MTTKRILRLPDMFPPDWQDGYPNVTIACTVENQKRADERLPVYLKLPIKNKLIICEPLLTELDLAPYLTPQILEVIAGGESGPRARPARFEWFLNLSAQCKKAKVPFKFKQTGANFIKDGKLYKIPRRLQHIQAQKANIDFY